MPPDPLPVDAVFGDVRSALEEKRGVVLVAPTGAGKTTRVPPALLDAGFRTVLVLEPRRLAARAAARRIAEERGVSLGQEVGYHVRFDRRAQRGTRLLVVTEGILLRRLQDDPMLEGVDCIVFDEFHERGLDADLALAIVRQVRSEVRDDLAIAVMSATVDPVPVAKFLDCPVVKSEGRLFPIDVEYLPARGRERIEEHVKRGIEQALSQTPGDLLVFLPGVGEIRRCARALEGGAGRSGFELHELYGDLPPERQDAVLRAGKRRKVVLATNVAETSVTVEGVTGVVDTGLARRMRYDPGVGLDRLELGRISIASADQRAGRAGRTAPGVCVRLWSEMDQRALAPFDEPEVRRVDLTGPVLSLFAFGEPDPRAFPWFEKPRDEAVERALLLLRELGALEDGVLTDLGRALARIPTHPRLARLVFEGARRGVPDGAGLAAALLSERDPFARRDRDAPRPNATDSDLLDRIHALEDFERTGTGLARGPARRILRAAEQFARLARDVADERQNPSEEALLRALFAAFPDRLARRREKGSDRAVMVGGRGVRLARTSGVTEPELFVCLDLDAGKGEALVRQASVVERAWLDPDRLEERVEVEFDPGRERVVGRKRLMFEDLMLEEVEHPVEDAALAERILAEEAARDPERVLGLKDKDVEAFLGRVRSLAEWMPELGLPVFDKEAWKAVLPVLCAGRRSFAELRKAPLLEVLKGALNHVQRAALEREAPERLSVPSGSKIRLAYEPGHAPVLAARIQELFGLRQTPRVASGRVPVLLHLLAPNGRPQQVTEDLESFWNTTYAIVRKELRRRYPRHAWPEDPWNAQAERRPGRKRT